MIRRDKKRGFTLIELLVAISIIALLSSIVLASVKSARDKAELRAFEKTLSEMRTSLQLYIEKVGDVPSTSLWSFNEFAQELSNKGVYSLNSVKVPSYVTEGGFVTNTNLDSGGYVSCGANTSNVKGIIYFGKGGQLISDTVFKELYYDGVPYTVSSPGYYYYCIEIR